MDIAGDRNAKSLEISYAFPAYASYPIGGYHVHFEYANHLAAAGHRVTLLFPRNLSKNASGLRALVWSWRLRRKFHPLVQTYALHPAVRVKLLRNLEPAVLPSADVLIATSWRTAEAMEKASPRAGRKCYIVYDYELWIAGDLEDRERIAATFRMDYRKLATSSAVSEMIRKSGGHELGVACCGIDHTVFGVDRPIGNRTPTIILFAARQEKTKNLAGALAALQTIKSLHGDSVHVVAYGTPNLSLPDFVEYHTRPSNLELRELYNRASIFLCASLGEGWGLPSVEAMACGAALVTTDNGGSRDYAYDGQTALVAKTNNLEALVTAIDRLVCDKPLREKLAIAGQLWVQRYVWETAASQVIAFVEDAAKAPLQTA